MSLNKDIHRRLMTEILLQIYSDIEISGALAFKGGTAAMFFYDLPRFSVDLDFDLMDKSKTEMVIEKITKIISKFGEIRQVANQKTGILFVVSYQEKDQNIKIEINKEPYGSTYELKTYNGLNMYVMKKPDMFANKLVAMYERLGKANRDIFDVRYFASKLWDISEEIIKLRTGKSLPDFLVKLIDKLENYNPQYILNGLGEVLTEPQKSWAKDYLIKETIISLKSISGL